MFQQQNHDSRSQFQKALDRDAARTQGQGVDADSYGLDFECRQEPTTPIFRRSTLPKKSFDATLFASLKRA